MMKAKTAAFALILLGSLFPVPAFAQDEKPKHDDLTMSQAWIADGTDTNRFVFVVNGVVAFKTVDGLKKYLEGVPKGSTLTWAPGCCRMPDQPLLGSGEEMKKFKEFCEAIGVKFTLVPSG